MSARHPFELTEHRLVVPLDHSNDDGRAVEIFARVIRAPDGRNRPFLLFLQGGPGHEAPRPVAMPSSPGWLESALQDYRVVMLDQRGTGLSTPYGAPGPDPATDAERLTHFRADAIVQDAELLREHLGASTWSLLGQSFGGFCSLHYLSVAPDSLREVFFTGGLPPVGLPVDDIYSATYDRMRILTERYYDRFPGDRERFANLLESSAEGIVRTPGGEAISERMLRTIGHQLGMDGGAEQLHYLLERDPASSVFAYDLAAAFPFGARDPLYAVLHESSYTDGGRTRWSAERAEPEDFRSDSLLFTGEHLFSWHFDEVPGLRPYRPVAEILAEHHWPRLFDADVLSSVDVPCAAAIYVDDPFVDRALSEQTADLIPSLRRWVTGEHLHNGLRSSGGDVLDHLIGLVREGR
ncbi:aminopeptidase [Subtercola boreus]|uniref:Aminopeptidase n=1 Tax=Subtercola boreus TaxID=120213 RepID=A0A3E0W155_9MICO|nr:alpha/beta fold hydrolase [Subtercola boreus]RFA15710.1 aminopeptidase [Subtercola boreus]